MKKLSRFVRYLLSNFVLLGGMFYLGFQAGHWYDTGWTPTLATMFSYTPIRELFWRGFDSAYAPGFILGVLMIALIATLFEVPTQKQTEAQA